MLNKALFRLNCVILYVYMRLSVRFLYGFSDTVTASVGPIPRNYGDSLDGVPVYPHTLTCAFGH